MSARPRTFARWSTAVVASLALLTTAVAQAVGQSPALARTGPHATGPVVAATNPALQELAPLQRIRLRAAVRDLRVAREHRAGYAREKFRDWYDADGDCQDTRDEVLAQESLDPVTGCDISTGRWYSYYDGRTWTSDDDLDIDHLVPLAEVWDSGAKRWTGGTRDRYANDLRDARTLVAVTDSVNQSKGDQDVAEWLPELARCRYVREWVVVNTRWSLQVDRTEKRRLVHLAADCRNSRLSVRAATVRRR